jgi:hypothetical protein
MNLLSIIKALRMGASLPNPTPIKWAGIFFAAMLIALQAAQQFGLLVGVSADDWINLSLLLLILYSQIATTDKVGILPAARAQLPELHLDAVPSDTVQLQHRDGFPDGPFFNNDR